MSRSGRINLVALVMYLGIAVGGYAAWLFAGPYLIWVKMQEITESACLSWEALNQTHGERRLMQDLRQQEMPDYLSPESCKFELDGKNKIVSCYWELDIYYKPTDYYKTLKFETFAMHDGISLVTD